MKIAKRYRFHSAVQRQSISDFVRELKKLAETWELTNEQLNDSLPDHFIWVLLKAGPRPAARHGPAARDGPQPSPDFPKFFVQR